MMGGITPQGRRVAGVRIEEKTLARAVNESAAEQRAAEQAVANGSAPRVVPRWAVLGLVVLGFVTPGLAGCGGTADVQGDPGATVGGSAGDSQGSGTGASTFDVDPEPGGKGSGGGGTKDFDLDTLTIVYDGPTTLDIHEGEELPTLQFTATVSGEPTAVGWSVDRGEIGSIDDDGLFTPRGNVGGWVTIRAGLNDKVVEVKIFVRIVSTQNGPAAADADQVAGDAEELRAGGGIGGVGGEGLGAAITDEDLLDLLTAGATDDGSSQDLEMLYPYDGTVFPRGMLAPLLMWRWDVGDADAVHIELRTLSGSFTWTGSFGRPEILATTGRSFIRHPIPQRVWAAATESAGESLEDGSSDTLHLSLSIAHDGTVYGPLTRTFAIAPGRLSGTVYYNSYGTALVENFQHTRGGQPNDFGAAVLAIRSGETAPTLASGYDSADDHGGCRACHTVSAQGSHLLVQGGGDDRKSWLRDLLDDDEAYLTGQDSIFAWAALSPDGSLALTNAVNASKHNETVDPVNHPYSRLWDMTTDPPSPVDETGLPEELRAALPTFSPDGSQVAFAYLGGSGADVPEDLPTDGSQLAVMDFDEATRTFSNFRVVATGNANDAAQYRAHGAGWPSFVPTGDRVVFQNEVRGSKSNETYIGTRDEARGELWWASTTEARSVRLDYLNGRNADGVSYLPIAGNKHGIGDGEYDDTTLSYEPTVAPVVTGGYAWVVFTSRRMYGNMAVTDPWLSDPRNYDFKDYDQVTTKKLWVAAIRVDAAPDEDPSYPAFYLPAQELLAGNARGYWVLDPCKSDGDSCATGDQCCGGFCRPAEPGSTELVCSTTTTTLSCSQEQERCDTAADCCDPSANCTGGFCARPAPVIVR